MGAEDCHNADELVMFRDRINYIMKVLNHYEEETVQPFIILGISLNRDLLTMLGGLGAGAMLGFLTKLFENVESIEPYAFCHVNLALMNEANEAIS